MAAWERADVAAILELLAKDARFTMPPLPAWFHGREDVGRFLSERVFATPWRLLPIGANGQLAFACYQGDPDGRFRLGAVNLLRLRTGGSWRSPGSWTLASTAASARRGSCRPMNSGSAATLNRSS